MAFGPFSLSLSREGIKVDRIGEYDVIYLKGYSMEGDSLDPIMPYAYLKYILPPSETSSDVNILFFATETLEGTYNLCPAYIYYNSLYSYYYYNSSGENNENIKDRVNTQELVYPPSPIVEVWTEDISLSKIATIKFSPLIYHPSTGMVEIIKEISFEFITEVTSLPSGADKMWILDNRNEINSLRNMVMNPEYIMSYRKHPIIVDSIPIIPIPDPNLPPLAKSTVLSYLIVAPDELVNDLSRFVVWMRQRGYPTYIVPLSDIDNYGSQGDRAEKLRQYLEDKHHSLTGGDSNNGTMSVLLVGGYGDQFAGEGTGPFPFKKGYAEPQILGPPGTTVDNFVPTDLYFADPYGKWDANGNNKLGEVKGDSVKSPTLMIGRIPVGGDPSTFKTQISNWMDKVIKYEKEGPEFTGNLDKTYWMISQNGSICPFPPYWKDVDVRDALPSYYKIIMFPGGEEYYYDEERNLYWEKSGRELPSDEAISITSEIPGFVSWHAHGWLAGEDNKISIMAVDGEYENDVLPLYNGNPSSKIAGLNHLIPDRLTWVLASYTCWSAPFDLTNRTIADGYIDMYPDRGAPLFIGNTRTGIRPYRYLNELFAHIYNIPYIPPNIINWVPLNKPKLTPFSIGHGDKIAKTFLISSEDRTDRYQAYSLNLFGSPLTYPWVNVVGPLDLLIDFSYNNEDDTYEIIVTVRHRYYDEIGEVHYTSVRNAIVSFYYVPAKTIPLPEGFLVVDTTDETGRVRKVFSGSLSGEMKITATKYSSYCDYPKYQKPKQYIPDSKTINFPDPHYCSGKDEEEVDTVSLFTPSILNGKTSSLKIVVPFKTKVNLSIYNLTGAKVKTIIDDFLEPGTYSKKINEYINGTGVYFLILTTNNRKLTRKIIILK